MVKYRPVKESSLKEYFSSLINPFLNLTVLKESRLSHRYKKTKPSKHISTYFNRFFSESRIKQIYKQLEFLQQSAFAEFEEQKSQGLVTTGMHPLEEKQWFIDYLKPRITEFSAEDAWLVILNDGQRDKYMRFLSKCDCVNRFEIFVQNYFFSALSAHKLVEIFILAYEGEENERQEKLQHLINSLSHTQAALLIETLRLTIQDTRHWVNYCDSLLTYMRNSQIKNVLFLLPYELEDSALKKLYPYEIIEVIEQLDDIQLKEKIIHKILQHRKEWWDGYSYDEVQQALSILKTL